MLFSVQRLHLETSLMANRYSSPLSPLRSPLQSPPQSPLQRFQLAVGSLCICTLIVALNGCSNAVESQQTLIENVNVVDPVNGLTQNQQVLIEDGVITAVADASQTLTLNASAERFDAQNRYLIPGLWDMHVHFVYDPTLTNEMADLFLDYGVTSVRDTGGDIEQLAQLRDALPSPKPNIYISGPLLDGKFVVYDGSDPDRPPLGTGVAESSAADATVAALKEAGADFIKIYELIQPETYAALVAAARQRDMPIASHVPLMMTADSAGPLADSMEHLRNIELACASNWRELLAQRQERINNFTEGLGYTLRAGLHSDQRVPAIKSYDEKRCNQVLDTLSSTIQVPTLRLNTVSHLKPFEREDWPAALAALPESTQLAWRARIDGLQQLPAVDATFSQWSVFLIERLLARGVPIGAGTDTPIGLGIPGYSLHTELEFLVQGGMTPQQALYAATITPAEFFNMADTSGRVTQGMRADLVLLQDNPLAEIRHSRSVEAVMLAGEWVRK